MSQAVIMSEAEQGASVSEWDTFSSNYNVDEMEQWFNKYLKDYLNIIKQEKKKDFYMWLFPMGLVLEYSII